MFAQGKIIRTQRNFLSKCIK